MRKFRKKPVEITAVQWTGDVNDVRPLTGTRFHQLCVPRGDVTAEVYDKLHNTWVGVKLGQWIIRGVQGEFYPCDPDVFEQTYEEIR